jgi:hypothetical protein
MKSFGDSCRDASGSPPSYNNPAAGFGNRNIILEDISPHTHSGHCILEGNRFAYGGTAPDDDGSWGIEDGTPFNIVRYNYMYGNGGAGYYFKQPLNDSLRLYNNTIYKNGGGDDVNSNYVYGINYYNELNKGCDIRNNINYGNIPGPIIGWGDSTLNDSLIHKINSYTFNFENNPKFVDSAMVDTTDFSHPTLTLSAASHCIDSGTYLTTVAAADAGSGTSLVVNDSKWFQDGTVAPTGVMSPDWIAVGTVMNIVQISSIDRATNTITLANTITRSNAQHIWLYKRSDGTRVLYGSAPDVGAYEYSKAASEITAECQIGTK